MPKGHRSVGDGFRGGHRTPKGQAEQLCKHLCVEQHPKHPASGGEEKMNILLIPCENEGFYLKLTSDLDDKFYKRLAFRNLERTCQWIRRNLKIYIRSEYELGS